MSATGPSQAGPTVRQYAPDDAAGYNGEFEGEGWVLFAGVILGILATLNLVDGIAAVSNSSFFVGDAKFVVSNLNTLGWVLIVTGVVQGATAVGVWLKTPGIRWVGVGIASLNAIGQMLMFPAYPFWALVLFTLDILVIYGLVAYGSRTR